MASPFLDLANEPRRRRCKHEPTGPVSFLSFLVRAMLISLQLNLVRDCLPFLQCPNSEPKHAIGR
jgi:hypothetical protein